MITINSVEDDAETPSTTGSSSSTSYLDHTEMLESDGEEIQSSAFSPSKIQGKITTTVVGDSTLSEAYSSIGSWTSKDVMKSASSHAFETTSMPLKGSQTVQMTSSYTRAVTDEDVDLSSSTFDREMETVSSAFGKEHLQTATSSDEPSSTDMRAMKQTTPTIITVVSKVEVGSHDSTTRSPSKTSASSTIASSQGHSSDVDLKQHFQTTTLPYSSAKEATTKKLFSELFFTSKVETTTAPKSSSLTSVNEGIQQSSETATPSTAAGLSDSSRRLSTVPFPFTTHGHYHRSSTISWSSPKTTESGSTDTSTSDASSSLTTRLLVTDASLKQQEKSSTVETHSTAGTTVDTQQTQTTADTSSTDSVTG